MRRKVLVADDEQGIVEMLTMVLEDQGYEVLSAFDGEQTIQQAIEHHPDVIVLDILMPKLDGIEVSRRLKTLPQTSDIPVILTSIDLNPDRKLAQADAFLLKPFDLDQLLQLVRSLVDRHQQGHSTN